MFFHAQHPIKLTENEAYAIAVKASNKLGINHKCKELRFLNHLPSTSLSSLPLPSLFLRASF